MMDPKARAPMTDEERLAADAIAKCNFTPGSPPKRFAREMSYHPEITEGQRSFLWKLVWQYRRQISSLKLRQLAWDRHGHTTKEPRP